MIQAPNLPDPSLPRIDVPRQGHEIEGWREAGLVGNATYIFAPGQDITPENARLAGQATWDESVSHWVDPEGNWLESSQVDSRGYTGYQVPYTDSQEFHHMVNTELERITAERAPTVAAERQSAAQRRRWSALGGWVSQVGRLGTVLGGGQANQSQPLGGGSQTLG